MFWLLKSFWLNSAGYLIGGAYSDNQAFCACGVLEFETCLLQSEKIYCNQINGNFNWLKANNCVNTLRL
jgi:hypothetical protein